MSFWVISGPTKSAVAQALFVHQNIDRYSSSATYYVKTSDQAFTDLKNKKAYIAAYSGTDANIFIKNVFLGYYLGDKPQSYLMPIYVFEGNNGFYAYVSAIRGDQLSYR